MRGRERWQEVSTRMDESSISTAINLTDGEAAIGAHTKINRTTRDRRASDVFLDKVTNLEPARFSGWNEDTYIQQAFSMPISDRQLAMTSSDPFYLPEALRAFPKYVVEHEEIDGRPCIVIDYPEYDKVWIDPALGGAPRRRERRFLDSASRPLNWRMEWSDYVETEKGLWAPRNIFLINYCSSFSGPELENVPFMETQLVVDELGVNNVEDSDFALHLRTGAHVHDFTTGADFTFAKEKNLALAELLESAAEIMKSQPQDRGNERWRMILGAATLALTLAIALTIAIRRRRRTADASQA
jgi:hypothetical protein